MKNKIKVLSLVFVLFMGQLMNTFVTVKAAEDRPAGNELREVFKDIYNGNGYKDEDGNASGYTDLNFVINLIILM